MEPSSVKNKLMPMPIAFLIPSLNGIMSRDAIQTFTAKKQIQATMMASSRTSKKNYKPLTLAELNTALHVLKQVSPRRMQDLPQSSKKRGWNSSVKVTYKNMSHTANGQMKNNPVRKVLNFQTKSKAQNVPVNINLETSIFPMPDFRPRKPMHTQVSNSVRISGICDIPQTPMESRKLLKSRLIISNKKNHASHTNIKRTVLPPTPISLINRRLQRLVLVQRVPDTPLLNSSWKSSDSSFLQKEKEINDFEEKVTTFSVGPTNENVAETSAPVSTPFREHRSVLEYFNHTSDNENSAMYNDNTIMCFDESVHSVSTIKREESVIVSLCDLLKKTTVNNKDIKDINELDYLIEIENQIKNNVKMLTEIKKAELKLLQNVTELINKKRSETDKILMQKTPKVLINVPITVKSPVTSRLCSLINSSTYKIPEKNLKKIFFCKSMPDVSTVQSNCLL